MIVYMDVFTRLSRAGWSTYRLAKEHVLSPSTIDRIRHGQPIGIASVDVICRLCRCQPGDILRYEDDEKEG